MADTRIGCVIEMPAYQATGAALPAAAGLRLRRRGRRRRAGGNRPEVQPAARPRHPAPLRTPAAGGHDDADPGRDRRARKMSKSLGNQIGVTDAPGRCSARRWRSPTRRWGTTTGCWWTRARPTARLRGRRAARDLRARREARGSRARSSAGCTRRRRPRRPRPNWDRVFAERELPQEIEEAQLPAEGRCTCLR